MQVNVYMCVHADIKWYTKGKMGSCVFNEKKKKLKDGSCIIMDDS